MTIPYELYCRWIQVANGRDGPKVSALRKGHIPFVPCKGFTFLPWTDILPVAVEDAEWSCDGDVLIIEAEYRDRADFIAELLAALKAKGIGYKLEGV